MGQGRENARAFLKENKDIRQEIENRLRQGLGLPLVDVSAAEPLAAASGSKGAVVQMPEKKRQPDKSA
jgi:recombination protein RecA